MKKCIFCDNYIEDAIMECPKCYKSRFEYISFKERYRNVSFSLTHRIDRKLKKEGIFFSNEQDKKHFLKEFEKYCKQHDIEISENLIDKFLPSYKEVLRKRMR